MRWNNNKKIIRIILFKYWLMSRSMTKTLNKLPIWLHTKTLNPAFFILDRKRLVFANSFSIRFEDPMIRSRAYKQIHWGHTATRQNAEHSVFIWTEACIYPAIVKRLVLTFCRSVQLPTAALSLLIEVKSSSRSTIQKLNKLRQTFIQLFISNL